MGISSSTARSSHAKDPNLRPFPLPSWSRLQTEGPKNSKEATADRTEFERLVASWRADSEPNEPNIGAWVSRFRVTLPRRGQADAAPVPHGPDGFPEERLPGRFAPFAGKRPAWDGSTCCSSGDEEVQETRLSAEEVDSTFYHSLRKTGGKKRRCPRWDSSPTEGSAWPELPQDVVSSGEDLPKKGLEIDLSEQWRKELKGRGLARRLARRWAKDQDPKQLTKDTCNVFATFMAAQLTGLQHLLEVAESSLRPDLKALVADLHKKTEMKSEVPETPVPKAAKAPEEQLKAGKRLAKRLVAHWHPSRRHRRLITQPKALRKAKGKESVPVTAETSTRRCLQLPVTEYHAALSAFYQAAALAEERWAKAPQPPAWLSEALQRDVQLPPNPRPGAIAALADARSAAQPPAYFSSVAPQKEKFVMPALPPRRARVLCVGYGDCKVTEEVGDPGRREQLITKMATGIPCYLCVHSKQYDASMAPAQWRTFRELCLMWAKLTCPSPAEWASLSEGKKGEETTPAESHPTQKAAGGGA